MPEKLSEGSRMKRRRQTVIFEKKYGKNLEEFSTTEEIDTFLNADLGKVGKKLGVRKIDASIVISRGNVFPNKEYDIDERLERALEN